ncbi:MAG: S1 RNA-binding domain-containing protein [Candidatus Promineofilum sp.]|nr:S1 RNA-binding domain-containing protein [Promineifilum sp.]
MSADTMEITPEVTAEEVAAEEVTTEEVVSEDVTAEETTAEEVTSEGVAADVVTAEATPTSIADLTPKMRLKGTVKRLELYGAFIDLGIDATGLVHISKIGGEQVNRVSDALKEDEEVTVWVEKVDLERQQVMLTMIPPLAVDWTELKTDQVYEGTVTRLETFGAFVAIGAEREGLVHISELSHNYVKHPSEVVNVGDEVQVKVLGFNRRKRRIDLSMKALTEKPEVQPMQQSQTRPGGGQSGPRPSGGGGGKRRQSRERYEPEVYEMVEDDTEEVPTAMEIAMRRALGNDTISAVKTEQRGGRKGKKAVREGQRQMQEELLKRTLTMQSDN